MYRHYYICPNCESVYTFTDLYKVSKTSTWEHSCYNCGVVQMNFYKTENRRLDE